MWLDRERDEQRCASRPLESMSNRTATSVGGTRSFSSSHSGSLSISRGSRRLAPRLCSTPRTPADSSTAPCPTPGEAQVLRWSLTQRSSPPLERPRWHLPRRHRVSRAAPPWLRNTIRSPTSRSIGSDDRLVDGVTLGPTPYFAALGNNAGVNDCAVVAAHERDDHRCNPIGSLGAYPHHRFGGHRVAVPERRGHEWRLRRSLVARVVVPSRCPALTGSGGGRRSMSSRSRRSKRRSVRPGVSTRR